MRMTEKDKIGIVGLGLIGGSLAIALKGRYAVKGLAHKAEDGEYALSTGMVGELARGLGDFSDCAAVVICTPLSLVRETAERLVSLYPDKIISDVGSVKGMLTGIKGRLIGGHPMAGTERKGVRAAKERLLENACYILTDYNGDAEALAFMKKLVADAGAIPVVMGAEEHDRLVGRVSHLVHMAAYCLVDAAIEGDEEIVGSGFTDTTRVASSPPDFWNTVAALNRGNIVDGMDDYIARLTELRGKIAAGEDITAYLAAAKDKRDRVTGRRKSAGGYILYVDVPDCVGSVAGALAALAEGNISIENLSVVHSREGAGGALRLEFKDEKDCDAAREILQ